MPLTAWEIAGLDQDYWCKHSLDIRIRLTAAGYLGGDWSYSLSAPKVLYDLPAAMRADSLEISEIQLADGDNIYAYLAPPDRVTNCSTMTVSMLTSVFPNAPWTQEDYGDLQVYADRLPDRPDSPIDAVERAGVGVRVELLEPERWHLVQGWRTFDPSTPKYSGHAFLVLANDTGGIDQVLEATSRTDNSGRKIGPRYRTVSLETLKQDYDEGVYLAVLDR
jgi:hypothetical protein